MSQTKVGVTWQELGIDPTNLTWTQGKIVEWCGRLAAILIQRGKRYGPSFLCPQTPRSGLTPRQLLWAARDLKLSRFSNAPEGADQTDNLIDDAGYDILELILTDFEALTPNEQKEALCQSVPTANPKPEPTE